MEDSSGQNTQEQTMALLKLQAVLQGHEATVKMLGKCFTRCIDYPGTALSRAQQQCIWNCTQRHIDTTRFVQQRFMGLKDVSGAEGFE